MKKFIIILLSFLFIQTVFVYAQEEFPYEIDMDSTSNIDSLEIGEIVKTDSIKASDGILDRLYSMFGLDSPTYTQGDNKAEYYIKMIVNILLGLVSFISLVLIIYSFYLIFFVKQEEGVAKAKKMLIGVFIALVFMGLSWLIVSFIFDFYKTKI